MPSWWGKSSSKEVKKLNKESFIDTLHRKFKIPSEEKGNIRTSGSRRRSSDTSFEIGSRSCAASRSPPPSTEVSRCQSFAERPQAQPLPLPGLHPASVERTDSGISISTKIRLEQCSKPLSCLPLPKPGCIPHRTDLTDVDGDLASASVSSDSSIDSDDPVDSRLLSPQTTDYESGTRTVNSPSSTMHREHSPIRTPKNSREVLKPTNLLFNSQILSPSPKWGPLSNYAPNLQIPPHGAFGSAPDSSMSSPSRSPVRAFGTDQITSSAFWAGKAYPDVSLLGSGHSSSPGSGHNSGHNSMGGDMSGQLFWQHSRGSPECSPIPSPRMASPGPSSRIHSGAVTPVHPRALGAAIETSTGWQEDGKQSHRLPLPPITIPSSSPFPTSSSPPTVSSSLSRSPGREENPTSPGSRWKKGKLLGRGAFGHVFEGFNSESGEMCAMKEVTLFSDDAKSKESAKQLGQEIALLSRLWHPNIVQYYGSETVDDKLYIYLEYVSGGSIHKLLQEYGQFGELAIRSYTQQILSGLAYLHAKNTVHRDIKGANILVDPNGRVKLADFGMAKHISGQSCPLSFKGSPYWMAPEVIKNSNGCNLAVDIRSLGCTVLEMATTKPPWGQYEGVVAMFKIGNSKELPAIPDHLSDEGKDFVRQCLQRNPVHRPTAAQLLEHPFVKSAAALGKPILASEPTEILPRITDGTRTLGVRHVRNLSSLEAEGLAIHQSRDTRTCAASSDNVLWNISCPVSPIGTRILHSRSPQHVNGRFSPSPISSPHTTSGSSSPLTGGNGAIPFHHRKQSAYLHEGFGTMPRSPNGLYVNGSTYHDPRPDLFQGMQPGSQVIRELMSFENDSLGKRFGRRAYGDSRELYDGQSVLADRVSQQLLRDLVKSNPSPDLGRGSPMLRHTNGF